jgi:hypothetical protein
LICLIIPGDEYKLWSSLSCNFLRSPFTSYISVNIRWKGKLPLRKL